MDSSDNPTAESKVNAAENVLSSEQGKDNKNFAVGLIILFIILAILFSIPFAIYWIWAKTKWSRPAKIISTVVLSFIAIGIIVLLVSSQSKPQSNYIVPPPNPTTTESNASDSAQSADWKTFTGGKVTFQYPASDYVKEFETEHYFLLPNINSSNDQQILDIDARTL